MPTKRELETGPSRKSLRTWFESLGWNKSKTTSQAPRDADTQVSNEQRFRSYLCLGKKKGRDVQRRLQIPGAARAMSDVDEDRYTNKCAVRQILDAIFADVVETDSALESQMDATTQCFLVHVLSDIDTKSSFLSLYQQLPPHAVDMDLDHGLSFASTWLQNSLAMIRDGYEAGEARLQMPFLVLETNHHTACMRASALRRPYPDEKAVIVAFDFMALKNAKSVTSAEHTFDFLRVSKENMNTGNKLLLWAESGVDGRPAEALLEAVLTIVEYEERDDEVDGDYVGEVAGDAVDAEVASEDGTCKIVSTDLAGPSKKDSVVTEQTMFEEDAKTDSLYPDNPSTPG